MGRMKDYYYEQLIAQDEFEMEMIELQAMQEQDKNDYFAYMEELALEREMKVKGETNKLKALIKTTVAICLITLSFNTFADTVIDGEVWTDKEEQLYQMWKPNGMFGNSVVGKKMKARYRKETNADEYDAKLAASYVEPFSTKKDFLERLCAQKLVADRYELEMKKMKESPESHIGDDSDETYKRWRFDHDQAQSSKIELAKKFVKKFNSKPSCK